jgi:hypothetical protein
MDTNFAGTAENANRAGYDLTQELLAGNTRTCGAGLSEVSHPD